MPGSSNNKQGDPLARGEVDPFLMHCGISVLPFLIIILDAVAIGSLY